MIHSWRLTVKIVRDQICIRVRGIQRLSTLWTLSMCPCLRLHTMDIIITLGMPGEKIQNVKFSVHSNKIFVQHTEGHNYVNGAITASYSCISRRIIYEGLTIGTGPWSMGHKAICKWTQTLGEYSKKGIRKYSVEAHTFQWMCASI